MTSQSTNLPDRIVQDSIKGGKPTGFSLIIPCFVIYKARKQLSLRNSNLEIGAKWKQRGLSFEYGFDPSKVNILKHFKYKETGFCISHERAVTFSPENSRIFFQLNIRNAIQTKLLIPNR